MGESEFKLFKLVEDTIEAVVTFVDRFLRTCFYLAFLPHRFADKWCDEASRQSFVKPFTFTAISVFAVYLPVIQGLRAIVITKHGPSFGEIPGDLSYYLGLSHLFAYAIPTIVVVYGLARVIGRVATWAGGKGADVARVALYACSSVCLGIGLWGNSATVLAGLARVLPLSGLLTRGFAIWCFIASVVVLGIAISRQTRLAKWKTMLMSALYGVVTFGCVVGVITCGIAIEFYPTWDAYSERERQAEIKALLEKLLHEYEEVDESEKNAIVDELSKKMKDQWEWEERKSLFSGKEDDNVD